VLKLQSYLASAPRAVEHHAVGSPVSVAIEADKYRQDVTFVTPGDTPEARTVIERLAAKTDPKSTVVVASIGNGGANGPGDTDRSGVYEIWPVTLAGEPDVRREALNVEPSEGDLALLAGKPLLDKLDPVPADYKYAEEYEYDATRMAGNNRSLLLMVILIGLLLVEQITAYSASYHPPRAALGRRG